MAKIIEELRKRYGMSSRVGKVSCKGCGKQLEVPNMYSEKERNDVLKPYCCSSVVLIIQWLIHHGWHVTTRDANPSGAYFCPDCFPKGQPEYNESPAGAEWCKQAEGWMKENNGKR